MAQRVGVNLEENTRNLPWFVRDPNPEIYWESQNYVVIDVENSIDEDLDGLPTKPGNELVYTSMYHPSKGWALITGNEIDLSQYLRWIEEADFIVAHNAKHELGWLRRAGLDISTILVYDTQLAEYCIAGNRKWALDLDSVAKRRGAKPKDPLVKLLLKNHCDPREYPAWRLKRYCNWDVENTHRIFKSQLVELKRSGLAGVAYTKNLFCPVITDLEFRGICLDPVLVEQEYVAAATEYNAITEELDKLTGGINMDSPAQVADFLFRKLKFAIPKGPNGLPMVKKPTKDWPNGQPSTGEDVRAKLRPKTKKQQRFVELAGREAKLSKRLSSYLNLFMAAVEHHDCLLHGKINQSVTKTHRLSSNKPNLQNIDRSLKKVITARHAGWGIRQNDYAQLEYRVAGFEAQCPVAQACIEAGEDPHVLSATMLFGEAFTKLDKKDSAYKELRSQAKPDTFKPLYGGMSGTERQVAYYKAFLEKHTGIAEWHESLLQQALATGKIVTPTGLTFYFPGTEYTKTGYVKNSTNIKNYPVQYFATGEIAVIGALYLWHRMRVAQVESFIVNEVHDSVVIEEHPDEREVMDQLSLAAMQDDVLRYLDIVYGIDYNFPLTIDMEINTNWGYDRPA